MDPITARMTMGVDNADVTCVNGSDCNQVSCVAVGG